jgi:hypothetical protein
MHKEINAENKGHAHEVSIRNKDSIGNWTINHSCYNLKKSLSVLCPSPETLRKAEYNGDGIINLIGEHSKQHSIQAMVWVVPIALSQI